MPPRGQSQLPSSIVRIFADENISRGIVEALRAAGHDVKWGQDSNIGASDRERMVEAFGEARIILTEDHDFTDMISEQRLLTIGLILVALHRLDKRARIDRVEQAVAELGNEFAYEIAVIEPARVRRRSIIRP
jgi:hypothetical protein